ncbi:MAG: hypothetical protein ACI4TP_06490, partial [Anaerotignum sp.]
KRQRFARKISEKYHFFSDEGNRDFSLREMALDARDTERDLRRMMGRESVRFPFRKHCILPTFAV